MTGGGAYACPDTSRRASFPFPDGWPVHTHLTAPSRSGWSRCVFVTLPHCLGLEADASSAQRGRPTARVREVEEGCALVAQKN